MVNDYIQDVYLPAMAMAKRRAKSRYELSREVAEWKKRIPGRFSTVTVKEVSVEGISGDVFKLGNRLTIRAKVDRGQLLTEEILAEFIAATPNEEAVIGCVPMALKHTEGRNNFV